MSDAAEVLAANAAFYAAFGSGDRVAMDELWATRAPVSCIHPGWPPVHGREKVMSAWGGILDQPPRPPVRPVREVVRVVGDTGIVVCYEAIGSMVLAATNLFVREDGAWRIVVCYEAIGSIVLAATNLFVREDGAWRMVHHQAGIAERAPKDILEGEPPPSRVH